MKIGFGVEFRQATLRLFVFGLALIVCRFVAPRIGLRAGYDAGNIGIFAARLVAARAASRPRFATACRLFLLFFCARAFALAFAPRQRIASSHLALL